MIKIPYNDLFNEMIKDQSKMRHCLFVGPPGSGKTTAAQEFCRRLIGPQNTWIGRVLFLNASDERSLEAVRTKVYPFARSTLTTIFQFTSKSNNKVIIFDEAETLTEQAQLSLRPLLNMPAKDLCIFFLCNSSSRLHPSLINRFCVLPFFPPPPSIYLNRVKAIMNDQEVKIAPLDALYTRCDIRSFLYHQTRGAIITKFIHSLLLCPLYEIQSVLEKHSRHFFLKDILSQILFCFASLGLVKTDQVKNILLLGNSDVLRVIPEVQWFSLLARWIQEMRQKFDCCI
jgi:GTPase SAR1 family protein